MQYFPEWVHLFSTSAFVFLFLLVLIALIFLLRRKPKQKSQTDHLKIENLNDTFAAKRKAILSKTLTPKEFKQFSKSLNEENKIKQKQAQSGRKVWVIDFDGDVAATKTESLRVIITALLEIAGKDDEVVLRLESPGGLVHAYGLAASQLDRLRKRGISLTVCVDKVAASGGYMMACIAQKIIAAPFAIVGSIGVVAGVPNLNKVLKKNDVQYFEMTAGKYKRTLTMLGEPTQQGIEKFQEQIEDTHVLFKEFVSAHRPIVDLEKVGTGEYWFGTRAQQHGLVDEILTSDDYLLASSKTSALYLLTITQKETLVQRIMHSFAASVHHSIDTMLQKMTTRPLL